MATIHEDLKSAHVEPTRSVTGLRLDIAPCELGFAECAGAGGCAVLTPETCKRACSVCGAEIHRADPDGARALVIEVVG